MLQWNMLVAKYTADCFFDVPQITRYEPVLIYIVFVFMATLTLLGLEPFQHSHM